MIKTNKYERIQLVRDFGYNTEENILVRASDNFQHAKRRNKQFLDESHFSLRLFTDDNSIDVPHYPILTADKLEETVRKCQGQNYHCIIAKPIDPKDCRFAGAALKTFEKTIVEIADGPGTVRRVTHDGDIDRRYDTGNFQNRWTNDSVINYCLGQFRKFPFDEVAFEFSWYNKPIGINQHPFIVWEITGDKLNGK